MTLPLLFTLCFVFPAVAEADSPDVKQIVKVMPSDNIRIGDIFASTTKTYLISFVHESADDIQITSTTFNKERVELLFDEEHVEKKKHTACVIRFHAKEPLGLFQEDIHFKCSTGQEIIVTLSGAVYEDLKVNRWQIDFGIIAPGEAKTRNLTLYPGAPDLPIETSTDVPGLRLSIDPVNPNVVILSYANEKSQGAWQGNVFIKSTNAPILPVRVFGMCR